MRFQPSRSRRNQPQKRPVIFVGCEGDDEDEYFSWLQQFLSNWQIPVHFQRVNLHGGGILKLTERAVSEVSRKAHLSEFVLKIIALDEDRELQFPGELEQSQRLARDENITLVIQIPCIEAHIVRHFPDLERQQFNSTREAKRFLRDRLNVTKIDRFELDRKIPNELSSLMRAGELTTGFNVLLRTVGVI